MADEQFDFLARFIHGIIGGFVGVPIGLVVAELFFDSHPIVLVVSITSLAIAVIAALFGEAFWRSIGEFFSSLFWR
jgi:hypothetical protein